MKIKKIELNQKGLFINDRSVSIDEYAAAITEVEDRWLIEKTCNFDERSTIMIFDLDRECAARHFTDPYDYP